MSTVTVSARTRVRDAVIQIMESRQGQSVSRVPDFAVSNRFLNEQETKQANTYCVLVTNEEPGSITQQSRAFQATLKMVLYAYHTKDPHAVLDAMIEDAYDALADLAHYPDLQEVLAGVTVDGVTTDEATTAAGAWAQAIRTWTFTFCRA